MPYYCLYFINPRSGRIDRLNEFEAADDLEAIRMASGEAGAQPLELWCLGRKVHHFAPRPLDADDPPQLRQPPGGEGGAGGGAMPSGRGRTPPH
ncbi:MAG: hypothetical protein M3N07_04550 [Pseudomonadota bacterium]|nr:hypothetical protein [Pseudomonadota bacterium]